MPDQAGVPPAATDWRVSATAGLDPGCAAVASPATMLNPVLSQNAYSCGVPLEPTHSSSPLASLDPSEAAEFSSTWTWSRAPASVVVADASSSCMNCGLVPTIPDAMVAMAFSNEARDGNRINAGAVIDTTPSAPWISSTGVTGLPYGSVVTPGATAESTGGLPSAWRPGVDEQPSAGPEDDHLRARTISPEDGEIAGGGGA